MKRRFSLFGLGFAMGILILLVVLNGKRASCNFFPNERVMDILRNKHRSYSLEALEGMQKYHLDSLDISSLLQLGDVDFSKSKTRQEPCRYYWIDGIVNEKKTSLYIENCDTIITIQNIYVE